MSAGLQPRARSTRAPAAAARRPAGPEPGQRPKAARSRTSGRKEDRVVLCGEVWREGGREGRLGGGGGGHGSARRGGEGRRSRGSCGREGRGSSASAWASGSWARRPQTEDGQAGGGLRMDGREEKTGQGVRTGVRCGRAEGEEGGGLTKRDLPAGRPMGRIHPARAGSALALLFARSMHRPRTHLRATDGQVGEEGADGWAGKDGGSSSRAGLFARCRQRR